MEEKMGPRAILMPFLVMAVALVIYLNDRPPVPDFKSPEPPAPKAPERPLETPEDVLKASNGPRHDEAMRRLTKAQEEGEKEWLEKWDRLIEKKVQDTLNEEPESPSDI